MTQEQFVDKAVEWLKENAHKYIYDAEVSRYKAPNLQIGGRCWEDFRKAMEVVVKENLTTENLTWEDIAKIVMIADEVVEEDGWREKGAKAYYTEVLKRYTESK